MLTNSPGTELQTSSGLSGSHSKEEIDVALEHSRLNYLSCKLTEMLQSEARETSPPSLFELRPDTPPKRSNTFGHRVKFVG